MWQELQHYVVDTLQFFTTYITHNYGWSIILLTLLFRVLILPLTFKSLKSMKAMQTLQPKLKELQEKYKDDKERQTKEMWAMYKQAGANPLTGCLPMLLQMPLFILLFGVLRDPVVNGYIFVNQSFFGMNLTAAPFSKLDAAQGFLGGLQHALPGMLDLSSIGIGYFQNSYLYLPSMALVALMVGTTFWQQMSMTMDPKQKPMMYMMNIFIVYISIMMPSGVLLYWVVSNIFQVIQQKFTAAPAAAVAMKEQADKAAKDREAKKEARAMKANVAVERKLSDPAPKSPERIVGAVPASVGEDIQSRSQSATGSLKKNAIPLKPHASKKGKGKKR